MISQDDRVHAALDGELPREAMTAAELERVAAMESMIAAYTSALRQTRAPDLTSRVMAALAESETATASPRAGTDRGPTAAPAGWLRQLGGWLVTPINLSIRPASAFGFALAAMLMLATFQPWRSAPRAVPSVSSATGAATQFYVQFRIEVPGASEVALAGSFTNWEPRLNLTEISPGVWSALVPLSPGVYDYAYVIDGTRIVVDPYAPRVADSFGGSNSRLFLPAPNGRV